VAGGVLADQTSDRTSPGGESGGEVEPGNSVRLRVLSLECPTFLAESEREAKACEGSDLSDRSQGPMPPAGTEPATPGSGNTLRRDGSCLAVGDCAARPRFWRELCSAVPSRIQL